MTNPLKHYPPKVLIAFACVYVFWGSTYLAIRFGVEVVSPFLLGSIRFLIAGPLMLSLCAARGLKLRQTRRDFALLAAIGILVLGIGNQGVVWAEQYLTSGLAALLVAVIPLYVALLELVLPGGESLRARGWAGIAIGFLGLLLLLSPALRDRTHGHPGQFIGAVATMIAAFSWTCGSVLSRRARLAASAFVAAGWQMVFAGFFNLALVFLVEGRASLARAHFSLQGFWSILWLIVFGSLVGYSAYIYLLTHVPVAKVATYAYINPIVAVILGALLLHERLVPIEYLGMLAILAAVFLVTSSKLQLSTLQPAEHTVET